MPLESCVENSVPKSFLRFSTGFSFGIVAVGVARMSGVGVAPMARWGPERSVTAPSARRLSATIIAMKTPTGMAPRDRARIFGQERRLSFGTLIRLPTDACGAG